MKDRYRIGELVKELGINKETVRYYERIGLLSKPRKDGNGYRIYTKSDLDILRVIHIIKGYGFTLKEIELLLHDEILSGSREHIQSVVDIKLQEIGHKIMELKETEALLHKVKESLLSQDIPCCSSFDN
jgi:MerR family Zn(II)-responsive transcriptional regulator of zntA